MVFDVVIHPNWQPVTRLRPASSTPYPIRATPGSSPKTRILDIRIRINIGHIIILVQLFDKTLDFRPDFRIPDGQPIFGRVLALGVLDRDSLPFDGAFGLLQLAWGDEHSEPVVLFF